MCALLGRDTPVVSEMLISISVSSALPTSLLLVIDKNCRGDFDIDKLPSNLIPITTIISYSGKYKQPGMRNMALSRINAQYVWFIDDDSILLPGSIENAHNFLVQMQYLPDQPSCIAGMIYENKTYDPEQLRYPIALDLLRGPIGCFSLSAEKLIHKGYKSILMPSGNKYPIVPFCQGTSMVFNTGDLKRVGGFLELLGVGYSSFEDSEPCFRLFKAGKRTIYSDNFPVLHKKANRVNNDSREYPSLQFYLDFFVNYAISLSSNRYPHRLAWVYYVFFSISCTSLKWLVTPQLPFREKILRLYSMLALPAKIASSVIAQARNTKHG